MAVKYKIIFILCEVLVRLVWIALLTYFEYKESRAQPVMDLEATSNMFRLG